MPIKVIANIYPSNGENGNILCTNGICRTIKSGIGITGNGIGSSNSPKILEVTKCDTEQQYHHTDG